MPAAQTKARKTLRRIKPHASLVDALGGPTAVAEAMLERFNVQLRPLAVAMWRQRTVPHQYRTAVAKLATERGKSDFIPTAFTLG